MVPVVAATSAGAPANTVVNESPQGAPGSKKPRQHGHHRRDWRNGDGAASVIGMTAAQAMLLLQAPPYDYMVTTQQLARDRGQPSAPSPRPARPSAHRCQQGSPITIFVVVGQPVRRRARRRRPRNHHPAGHDRRPRRTGQQRSCHA